MKYKILYWPNEMLKECTLEVQDPTLEKDLVANLFETMYDDRGIGLSANQCGILKNVFVMDTLDLGGEYKQEFINPSIVETEGTITHLEGCLSFPGIFFEVERAQKVVISSQDLTGEEKLYTLTGIDAICAQHEIDHLNGIVFFDYLGDAKRSLMEQRFRKIKKKIRKHRA